MAMTDEDRFRIHEKERERLAAIVAAEKAAKKKITPGRVAKWAMAVVIGLPMLWTVVSSLTRFK